MKKVCFILLLLCSIVCSCEKDAPKDLLIGNWEVSMSTIQTSSNPIFGHNGRATTNEYPYYFSFEKNGHGRYVYKESLPVVFSYKYNSKDNSIEYQVEDEKGIWKNVWFIDMLTEDQLIFHEEYDSERPGGTIIIHVSATYKGVRMK